MHLTAQRLVTATERLFSNDCFATTAVHRHFNVNIARFTDVS